jgi:outer membrane PBP1 activator LpoA protein
LPSSKSCRISLVLPLCGENCKLGMLVKEGTEQARKNG